MTTSPKPPTVEPGDTAPPLASLMGVGGLIPFFVCAGAAHSGVAPWAGLALIISGIYGAVILSFVGAVHWGLAMQGDRSAGSSGRFCRRSMPGHRLSFLTVERRCWRLYPGSCCAGALTGAPLRQA